MYETIMDYPKFAKPLGHYNNVAFLIRLLHVSSTFFHFHNVGVVTSS